MKDDQVFELIMSKMDALHDDIRQFQIELNTHIKEDQTVYKDVNFIKRAFQVTWTAFLGWLAFLGVKDQF